MRTLLIILLLNVALPVRASAPCWQLAASEGGITVELLQAIAWTESSMNPRAINESHTPITGTRDIGLVGINTAPRVLHNLGVTEADLFDACTNLRVGARLLREKIVRHGMTWEAVGAYRVSCTRLKGDACRSARAAYAWRVYRAMHRQVRRGSSAPLVATVRSRGESAAPYASVVRLQ